MSKYWFKRRRYGLGWYPVTTAGWLVTLGCIAAIFGGVFLGPPMTHFVTATAVVILVVVAALKGPSPRWRWGAKPTDNSREDW